MDLLPVERDRYIGKKFGKLTVIHYEREIYQSYYKRLYHHYFYRCRCDCGNEKAVRLSDLLSGRVRSCGCYRKSLLKEIGSQGGYVHGGHGTRLYNIWSEIHSRCDNPNCPAYKNYGGRGIRVCDEWSSFIPFRDWALSNGYAKNLSIDRKDNDGDYSPDNCRWVTMEEQGKNRRNNVYISYVRDYSDIGKDPIIYTYTLSDWSRILGVDKRRLSEKLKNRNGKTVNEIIESCIKPDHLGFVIPNGVTEFPDKYSISIHD